jgi:glutaredoxin
MPEGYVVDVALMDDNQVVAAIEIRQTHAVDDKKHSELSVPYIEVEASEVMSSTDVFKPLRHTLRPFKCQHCADSWEALFSQLHEVSQKTQVPLPQGTYYRMAALNCWKCRKVMLAFDWPGNSYNQKPRPPIPKTIQYRYSKTAGGKYWANTCPHCKALQGAFFLHSEPDSPLFACDCESDSPESWREDMLKIAFHNGY